MSASSHRISTTHSQLGGGRRQHARCRDLHGLGRLAALAAHLVRVRVRVRVRFGVRTRVRIRVGVRVRVEQRHAVPGIVSR